MKSAFEKVHPDEPKSVALPGQLGVALGVGGGDVAHGGLLCDAEQAHQSERVGAFGSFVENAVLSQTAQSQPAGRAPLRRPMLTAGWSGSTAVFWLTSR